MIASRTASLSLSLANGVLKLARQLDRLQAERTAFQAGFVLPMPDVSTLTTEEIEEDLKALLDETEGQKPEPISAADRAALEGMFGRSAAGDYDPFYERLAPDRMLRRISPDDEFRQRLEDLGIVDEEARLAAFYVYADDDRRRGYAWRLGLTVADALTELGAESTALFIRDPKLQQVAQAVLTRFAEADLGGAVSWKGLLRHALQSTLNGALDARESLEAGPEWVESVLDALAGARDRVDPAQADNFIAGLVRGKGYRLLIGAAIETAAGKLGGEGASAFEKIAVDFLSAAAPLVDADAHGFKDFFHEHWGDLLRAGFTALEAHGPALLEGDSPVLRQSLLAILGRLAETPENALFSRDTLLGLVESTLAVVVRESLDDLDEPWLEELVASLAAVLADKGVREVFTRQGVEELLRGALVTFADHPELLADKPGLVRDVVGEILKRLAAVPGFGVHELAQAAVEGALDAVSTSPSLLDGEGGKAIAELAGLIAEQVKTKTLSKIQGADLLRSLLAVAADHPELITGEPGLLRDAVSNLLTRLAGVSSFGAQDLAQAAVESLLEAASTAPELLASESGKAIAELAGLIADQVKARTLTKLQGKDLLWSLLAVLSDHPELITGEPSLLRDAVSGLLTHLEGASSLGGQDLAQAAVLALLEAAAASPKLLGKRAGKAIAELAGLIAEQVKAGTLTGIQGKDLLRSLLAVAAAHPELITDKPSRLRDAVTALLSRLTEVSEFGAQDLAQAAVEALLEAASTSPELLASESGKAIAELAGLIADQVRAKTLTKLQGKDVLRALLATLADHPELIAGGPGLLRDALAAVLARLGDVSDFDVRELAQAAVETLLEAASTSPELLASESGKAIAELAGLIAEQVKAETLTKLQGKDVLLALLTTLASHPELLAGEPGRLRDAVAEILARLQDLGAFDARVLATEAVAALLDAVAADPRLLAEDATRVLADFAGFVAAEVRARTLTKIQAADLLHALVAALPKNPQLFLELESKLAAALVRAVLKAGGDGPAGLLAGGQLVSLAQGVLESFAARGSDAVQNQDLQALLATLTDLLLAGLAHAAEELGQGFDLEDLAPVLIELVAVWLSGEMGVVDPQDPAFRDLFDEIVDLVAA